MLLAIVTGPTFYWVVVWGLLGFGLPEAVALATGHGEWTLSETIWRLFDIVPGQTPLQWSIVHYVFAAAMTWLFIHFVFNALRVWQTHKTGAT